MKKILCYLVAALTIVTLFAGCKKKENYAYFDYNMDEYVTLGQYEGIKVEVGSTEFQDQIMAQYQYDMKNLKLGKSTELKSGKVKYDDAIHIVYEGKLNGVPFTGGSTGKNGTDITVGSANYIEGFESGLIGVELGKTVDLNLTFPKDYSSNPDLAGKAVVFTVTVQKITRDIYPELTNEIAKQVQNNKYNSLIEYKAAVLNDVKKNYVWVKVVKASKAKKYPEKEKEYYVEDMIQNYTQTLAAQGATLDDYLQYQNTTLDAFKESIKNNSNNGILEEMVVHAIAQKEKITITTNELNTEITKNKKSDGSQFTEREKAKLSNEMLADKVIEFVVKSSVNA